MTADRLPAAVREFANYLDGLLARLDPSGGWYAVFWQRDPEGMRACLDGHEMPPWDVVEALLRDLAGQYGPGGVDPETERARSLHAAALAAYDTRPGGRDALGDRLDVMLREQKYAAERQAVLARQLTSASTREQADALRLDLAWARDDHERASARCAELRARMAHLDRLQQAVSPRAWSDGERLGGAVPGQAPRVPGAGTADRTPAFGGGLPAGAGRAVGAGAGGRQAGAGGYGADGPASGRVRTPSAAGDPPGPGAPAMPWPRTESPSAVTGSAGGYGTWDGAPSAEPGDQAREHPVSRVFPREAAAGGTPDAPAAPAPPRPAPEPAAPRPSAPVQRKRRRGGARFAGLGEEESAPLAVPTDGVPALPAPAPATGRTPRGARFAGAAEKVVPERPAPEACAVGAGDRAEVVRTVEALARLRSEGRSGEAHALLAEAAYGDPARFPLFAEHLHHAGLEADWQTLLWEAASLPAGRLVAAADALVAAGRAGDGRQMLRQGVARPPGEVGEAVLGLLAEGRHREVRALLDTYVRSRTPEEAARSAEPGPRHLVPLLLQAAQGVSVERRRDLVHALRVAGHPV